MAKYKMLNIGDKKPEGYEYRASPSARWLKGNDEGSTISASDYVEKEYRILIEETEMKFKIGDEVKPVKMAKETCFWYYGTIEQWGAIGSMFGKVVEISKSIESDEHLLIRVKNNSGNRTFSFREDELRIISTAIEPIDTAGLTHPDDLI